MTSGRRSSSSSACFGTAPLIRILEALELAAYRAADAVVVVTEGFRDDLLRRGVARREGVRGPQRGRHRRLRADRGRPRRPGRDWAPPTARRWCSTLGAHGISHGLDTVADAAAKLTGEPIHFAFVGEGAAKRRLLERVAELGLANVTMLDGVPHDQVPELLAAADICLVPLRDVPLFSSFIPSKIFEYFAVGQGGRRLGPRRAGGDPGRRRRRRGRPGGPRGAGRRHQVPCGRPRSEGGDGRPC